MKYNEKITIFKKHFSMQVLVLHEGQHILYVEDMGHKRVVPKCEIVKIENGW
jgi:hypothetical protein